MRDIEPMAFDFVMNFAKDNDLLVTEACELPPEHGTQQALKAVIQSCCAEQAADSVAITGAART